MSSSSLALAGDRLATIGRAREARLAYEKALRLDPGDAIAACGLAYHYMDRGKLGAAVHFARAASSGLSPFDRRSTILPRQLGFALWRSGLWEEAAEWLARYVDKAPWDVEAVALRDRIAPPRHLPAEIRDSASGRRLKRHAAREGETFIYTIDIVGTCNLRCPTCPVGNSEARPLGFMKLDMFEGILDKIARERPAQPVTLNLFNWGEPLLHPDLPKFIGAAKRRGMRVQLSSNLNVTRGLDELAAADPHSLKISLSGFSQQTYGATHARGKLDLVKANMAALRAALDCCKASTHVWACLHLYKHNLHEREPLRAFCAELRFEYHEIDAYYMPLERVIDQFEGVGPPPEALSWLRSPPAETRDFDMCFRGGSYDCELRFNQIVINHDGQVALCCSVFEAANMLGVSYLETPEAEIEARKYAHPTCAKCREHGLNFEPPDIERAIEVELAEIARQSENLNHDCA